MLFIGFDASVAFQDIPDLIITPAVCAGAFAIQGAFRSWRGRSTCDPLGQVQKAEKAEPGTKASTQPSDIEVGTDVANADEA